MHPHITELFHTEISIGITGLDTESTTTMVTTGTTATHTLFTTDIYTDTPIKMCVTTN